MSTLTPTRAHTHAHGHAHTHGSGVGGGGGGGGGGHGGDAAATTCCTHHNIQLERYMLVYLVGGVLVLTTIIAQNFFDGTIPDVVAQAPAFIGALLLGAPLFTAAVKELWKGHASTSSLASLAILAAISIGQYTTAGLLAFILLVADQFVRQRAWGAQRAIEDLIGLTPDTARVVEGGGAGAVAGAVAGAEREVGLSTVKVGDVVRVRAGENLPVDGVVVRGASAINQASLTGEAVPHEVQPGEPVYAGTTNLSGVIDVRATQVGEDTTIGKVTQLIREAEQSRTPRQLLIEQVSRFFVPVSLSVAFVTWFLTGYDVERAIAVLVVACPSALLLSSPMAMVAAFAAAARLGILIKQTTTLEAAAGVDTVVMDKTGTMTTGRFAVAKLAPGNGVEGAELLRAAATGEQHSNHPLAKSILQTAAAARVAPEEGATDFQESHGRGIRAQTPTGELLVGRATWLAETFPALREEIRAAEAKIEGMSGVHVVRAGRYLGVVGLEDKVRSNTRGVMDRLRELGVRRLAIFTGDRLSVAERVGRAVGVDTVEAECHPEEKHALIEGMVKQGRRVMMVGDGINDGPSLAAADVGVAMGLGGSDIAANSAGVALMNDDLSRVPFLIELARRTRTIIAQNIAASILISIIGLTVAATAGFGVGFGVLMAALYHGLGDVFVIGNSFRLFRFGESFQGGALEAKETREARAPLAGRRAGSLSLRPVGAGV